VVANACCAFQRLAALDKLDLAYASPLARFGVAQVRDGRRVGTRINSRDVYSARAQSRRGFRLESLELAGNRSGTWSEILADDSFTPVPDQAAFRLDFTAWLKRLGRRDRRVAEFLALGHSPSDAARRFHISRARVSQLRAQLRASWEQLQCDHSVAA